MFYVFIQILTFFKAKVRELSARQVENELILKDISSLPQYSPESRWVSFFYLFIL